MAKRSELEGRETQCASLDDFLALAAQAAEEPSDHAYARELLHKAELHCQMPLDYINLAGEVVTATAELDFARDLYEQAEELLFDAAELTAFAHGIGVHLGERERAREYLDRAAAEAGGPDELAAIERVAESLKPTGGGDGDAADAPEAELRNLDDVIAAAERIRGEAPGAARGIMERGARHCGDAAAGVRYAAQILRLFEDRDWARRVLDEAELDCRFTSEFVVLAEGFKHLLGDTARIALLLSQAAQLCMDGEERFDLADGYWRVSGERGLALDTYRQALGELDDKERLLAFASRAAGELASPELARAAYEKAASRMPAASELIASGQRLIGEGVDREQAAHFFDHAAERLVNPGELASLGTVVLESLGDRERARAVFEKALREAGDHVHLLRLVPPLRDGLGDEALARGALERAFESAATAPHLVEVAEAAAGAAVEALAQGALAEAEERIASLGEARAVAEAVRRLLPDDPGRITRLADTVARREANEAAYARMQAQERSAADGLALVRLADAVMRELDDEGYARRLLSGAERHIMGGDGLDASLWRELSLAVHRHLGDEEWVAGLVDAAAARCGSFADVQGVAEHAAASLGTCGPEHARRCLRRWEEHLHTQGDADAYDYAKLAGVLGRIPGEHGRALALLERAGGDPGCDHFTFAHLAALARHLGGEDRAQALWARAFGSCERAGELVQLARRLRDDQVPEETIRAGYAEAGARLPAAAERLAWVEGIIDVLEDREWGRAEYEAAAAATESTSAQRLRFTASRRARMHPKLY